MALGIAVYVAFALTMAPFIYLGVRMARSSWDNKNDQVYEALRSPSVRNARNAFDRRVALAIREAKQGHMQCITCGFGNSVRVATCVLCGAALPTPAPKGVKKFFKKERKEPVTVGASIADPSRLRRVRRRREWVRGLDADGRAVWKNTIPDASKNSYIFETSTSGVLVPSPSRTTMGADHDAGHVILDIDETSGWSTAPEVTKQLQHELSLLRIQVVNAVEGEPSRVAFAESMSDPESHHSLADAVSAAELDFPSKLAQFITSMASIFNEVNQLPENGEAILTKLVISRSSLLAESIHTIATMSPKQARASVRVDFEGETGIDAGGVYREWFVLLNEAIITPECGIFTCVDAQNQTYYLNPHSRQAIGEHHLAHCLAAGRLLGRALLEGNVTGFHLSLPLLKIILGLPVSFADLEYFDPDVYKNLTWLLEHDDVDMLGLDFTVTEKLPDGSVRTIELVTGGAQVDVTDANKHEYVDRKLQYMLFESVSEQLFAFLKGLYEVVPAELLMLFDAEELDYILSGSDEIDVDDWEAHTLTSRNLPLHPAFFNFWKVVRELSSEQQRRLLQYATGSTRVPPGGFSALTSHDGRLCLFTLRGVPPAMTWGCLHSHACFNRLDVPMHRELDAMREAVVAAISSEVVGFTTA